MAWNKSAFAAHRNGPAISRQFSGGLYSRTSSGNLQSVPSRQRGKLCSPQSVFAFVTGIILTIMFLRSPAFHLGNDEASAAPGVHLQSGLSPSATIFSSLLGSQNRELASSALRQNASSEAAPQNSVHRKELVKPEQNTKKAIREAVASSANSILGGLHAGQAFLAREKNAVENDVEGVEASAEDSHAPPEKASKESVQESQTEEDTEEAEDVTATLNREETEAAAFEGLRDALKSTDKEASVDIKLEKEGGKESGKEEHTSGEEEEDEDEEPAPETLSGASKMQDSAILDDFINGASLQVTERNGMIVPEELHKADSKPKQEAAETDSKPQEASTSSEQATQQEQSGNASEIKTAVTTEEMSVEQTVSDNEGKPEGWTAELEQPKITTAVETEAQETKDQANAQQA